MALPEKYHPIFFYNSHYGVQIPVQKKYVPPPPINRFSLMDMDEEELIPKPKIVKSEVKKTEEPKILKTAEKKEQISFMGEKFSWSEIKMEPKKDFNFIVYGDTIYQVEKPDYFKLFYPTTDFEFEK